MCILWKRFTASNLSGAWKRYATEAIQTQPKFYSTVNFGNSLKKDVLVVGGGSGGIGVAAQLVNAGK